MEPVPQGLTHEEFEILQHCVHEVKDLPCVELVKRAAVHLERVRRVHRENAVVNLPLAQKIYDNFLKMVDTWETVPTDVRPWLLGMMLYYTISNDIENDFTSPDGFVDDARVMNACLQLVRRDDLCVDPYECSHL